MKRGRNQTAALRAARACIGSSLAGPFVLLLCVLSLIGIRWMAEPKSASANSDEAWFEAARAGDLAAVERGVRDGTPVDSVQSGSRMTALMWAVRGKHADVVKFLLSRGADVHGRTAGYTPPLCIAAQDDDAAPMVRMLLAYGADPNGGRDGHTPLMWVAGYGDVRAGQLLIDAGARIDARDRGGDSALEIAIACNFEGVVHLLQRADATRVRGMALRESNQRGELKGASMR
jgi:ankyrin repeat protein